MELLFITLKAILNFPFSFNLFSKMRQQHSPDRAKKKKVTKKGQVCIRVNRTYMARVSGVLGSNPNQHHLIFLSSHVCLFHFYG